MGGSSWARTPAGDMAHIRTSEEIWPKAGKDWEAEAEAEKRKTQERQTALKD